ncbi:MAG TPA: SDR family oxidoreductase [Candidatus Binataceae bacterium]|nr:SDR family oxidoreductase [Candidatus Binataceae bacterium]
MPVVLITGSSTGIGLATAVAFGRAKHEVYATMRRPQATPELAAIARSEKLPIKILPMDVDDDQSVNDTIANVLAEAGQVDALVNNAGIHASGAIEEIPLSDFRRVMETNYFGALRCIQAVLPSMRQRRSGHIVNISSVGGRIAGLSQAPYTASKWALEALSEELAPEVKPFGIRVALVEPGATITPIFDKRRQIPSNGLYRLERRMNAIYDAMVKQAPSASAVGERIVDIVQTGTWKLRHPDGPFAEPFLQYRAALSDEQWIDLRSIQSDEEFAAVVKRDFGLDLDL